MPYGDTDPRVVLCYGDSNTWGANPADLSRFPHSVRWPGRLSDLLGSNWRVIEEGLPNRTSAFDDPIIPMRRGDDLFPVALETHSPVDFAIVMLGTNDPKIRVGGDATRAIVGFRRMANVALEAGAQLILVAPPLMCSPIKYMEFEEDSSIAYCHSLASALAELAHSIGVGFLDAASVACVSALDGVHLDAPAHARLADALTGMLLGKAP
jgi:lysophospholipase L1-like esterase